MAVIFLSIACIANSFTLGYLIHDLYFKYRGISSVLKDISDYKYV